MRAAMFPTIDPAHERERLRALHALKLMDTPAEPIFDRITHLATRTLKVPIAYISLVDEKRQWLKSRVGLDITETSRDLAFCAHTVLLQQAVIVNDTTQDERFKTHSLVTGEHHIRFYAGIPITSTQGLALGAFCVMDTVPRVLSTEELDTLNDLAALVSHEIQLRETTALARHQVERSQAAIESSGARFRAIFERAAVGISLVGKDNRWIDINDALCNILGYSREELEQLTFWDLVHPDDLADMRRLSVQLQRGEIESIHQERRVLNKEGRAVWLRYSISRLEGHDGKTDNVVGIFIDIQARKEAEQALAMLRQSLERQVEARTQALQEANRQLSQAMAQQVQSEQSLRRREAELRSVIEHANDAYVRIDEDGVVTAWNRQAVETFGWEPEEALGQPLDELVIPPAMRKAHRAGIHRYVTTGEAHVLDQRLELTAQKRDGTPVPVEVRIRALRVEGQSFFSAFLHDISERKAAEKQRSYEARHDALTGLLNRRALMDILPKAIVRAERNRMAMALLFLDLDGFKVVNDARGHDAGDALLREIAHRLQAGIRRTDEAIRLGGDEFTVILEGLMNGEQDACQLAEKLLNIICKPVDLEGYEANVSASIGITVYTPGKARTADDLIKTADTAMYEAKRAGKARFHVL
jgi:diguanylate cyclase (GGDEF)-like protein/PAS domain S-box-containing protein